MSRKLVEITGINTNELKVLSKEETSELFKKMHSGEMMARETLIQGNYKLVLSLIKKYVGRVDNLDDLFQVGCIGLVKAIDNFDISYNLQLSTYAVPLIIGEVKRYIRDNTSVRISRSVKDLAYQIIKFKDEYTIKYGINPKNEDIARELNVSEYDIGYALDALKDPISLFEPIYNDGGDTIYLEDKLADNKNLETQKDELLSLRKALEQIKPREKDVLVERFIMGKTQIEIADYLGISQAQVSRIEKNAMNNVRKLIK